MSATQKRVLSQTLVPSVSMSSWKGGVPILFLFFYYEFKFSLNFDSKLS